MADIIRFFRAEGLETEKAIADACIEWKEKGKEKIPVLSRIDADTLRERINRACAAQGIPPG